MLKGLKAGAEVLFVILAAVALLWMFAPVLFGFTASQTVRWGQVETIPEVLDEWWMEHTNGGRITITHEDGSRSVISTRNGEPVKAETFGADGAPVNAPEAVKQDWYQWKKFQSIWRKLYG